MKIAVTGSHGLIGSALIGLLEARGDEVVRISRRRQPGETNTVVWDLAAQTVETDRLRGVEAVVHLAGESLAGRWTEARKKEILESRRRGTRLLSEALAGLDPKPRVLLCASGISYYGDRGDEPVTEETPGGHMFLSEVVRVWEASADPARLAGIRVVHGRFGIVLSPHGGALVKLLLPFRLGLGARFGSGEQFWSWVALEDLVSALVFLLEHDALDGPVNVTAPRPARNRELTAALARVLGRPAPFVVPAFALKALLGQMAEETLLAGQRGEPARLDRAGFSFRWPEIETALAHLVKGR